MARYIDADKFYNKIKRYSLSNGTTLGKHSGIADEIIDVLLAEPIADVVPRSEVNDLEYKLTGVMHSVDKWLDGEELNQDEVNRAITMREKTLNIVEELQQKLNDYKKFVGEIRVTSENHAVIIDTAHTEYIDKRVAEGLKNLAVKQAKQDVAREIFEEIEKLGNTNYQTPLGNWVTIQLEKYSELKKKYIGE